MALNRPQKYPGSSSKSSGSQPQPATLSRDSTQPWEKSLLTVLLVLGACFRLWNLGQNEFGNPYYASAVRSMLMSWHNFFFVSFDPLGWVTVDKPPVALWAQALSAYLFGFKGFSLILPQVLEGLASMALVWALVRRRFDAWAALFAAAVMALSPISVAVDRYNNVDACLVLVLLCSAWALVRATETANRWLLLLSMALAGVAFNTKMMAAFVVLPAFYLVYLAGAPATWWKKLAHLAYGTLILAVVSLSWPMTVDLTPPEQRPYVGSTPDNSMVSLSLGWNGFQRILRGNRGPFPRGQRPATPPTAAPSNPDSPLPSDHAARANPAQTADAAQGPLSHQPLNRPNGGRGRGGRGAGGFMGSGQPGPLRLTDRNMAGQMAWFFPLALVGFFIAWRPAPTLLPLPPVRQHLLLWAGWLFMYWGVFSFMQGSPHLYYLVLMVPPFAALSGIGIRALWVEFKSGNRNLFPLVLLLSAAWQAFIVAQFPDWALFLLPILLLGISVAAVGLATRTDTKPGNGTRLFLGAAVVSLFFCPAVWALSPVLGSGRSVEANPELMMGDENNNNGMFGRGGGEPNRLNTQRLADFLMGHHGSEKYLVAAQNSQAVAPLIIQTGMSAIALGGFMGGDPIVTANEFAEMVKEGQVRYFLLQGGGGPFGAGTNGANAPRPNFPAMFGNRGGYQAQISQWVRENGVPVDPKLWGGVLPAQPAAPGGWGGLRRGAPMLYDLRPDAAGQSDSKGAAS